MFIWILGKLTVYYRGLNNLYGPKHKAKFVGHFRRFRHNKNITDISGSNQIFLTVSHKEKNKQNTLFKHPILRSEFSVCSNFKVFSSYGLIFYMLNNGLLNSNSLKGAMSGNALKNHFLRPQAKNAKISSKTDYF